MSPGKLFMLTAALVFALFFGASAVVVCGLMPRTYAATVEVTTNVRDKAMRDLDLPALVQSQEVMRRTVEVLKLNTVWGKKNLLEGTYKPMEAAQLLQQKLEARSSPEKGTILIHIVSDDAAEAAQLANKIAEVFCAVCAVEPYFVTAALKQRAQPPKHPNTPNIPLDLGICAMVGLLLAFSAGSASAWFGRALERRFIRKKDKLSKRQRPPAPKPASS